VATDHADGTVRLWDPQTGVQQLVLAGAASAISHVAFSPDGSKLVSVGEDGVRPRVGDRPRPPDRQRNRTRHARTVFDDDEYRQYVHLEPCRQP
jgi:WD40 repeat protein